MTQNINNINPNLGNLSEAMAASQAITFTATDRKIIEERGGTMDKKISFRDAILQKKDQLLPEVENEQTMVKPDVNVAELQNRQQQHQEMLKRSPFNGLKEHQTKEENSQDQSQSNGKALFSTPENQAKKELSEKTLAMAAELKFVPQELMDKFSLDEKELHDLIFRIKNLHLKRLLTEEPKDFEELTHTIKRESINHAKPEARKWLEQKLLQLTSEAANYKVNFLRSLQSIEFDAVREKAIKLLSRYIS
jgi:hypothetical protein